MAKKEITKSEAKNPIITKDQLPEWMQSEAVQGKEEVGKYQQSPRLTVVQPQSAPETKAIGPEGSAIIQPEGTLLIEPEQETVVIPIAFWATWEIHSDIDDNQSPYVIEQSFDPTSEIARKSRSRDTREETYGDGFTMKFVECLNFAFMIDEGPMKGQMVIHSFSGGEHSTGRRFCTVIQNRPVSIFANRFALSTALRQRDRYSWYGFVFNAPSSGQPIVDSKEQYDELQTIYEGVMEAVQQGAISADTSDADGDASTASSGSDAGGYDDDLPPM